MLAASSRRAGAPLRHLREISIDAQPMKTLRGRSVETAIVGIYTILLIGAIIGVLSFGRDICIPIALAALVAFLLAPVVSRLERWVGRIAAVITIVVVLTGFTAALGYVVANQVIDLTAKLPDYETNIRAKLRSIQTGNDSRFARVTHSIEQLRKEMPGAGEAPVTDAEEPVTPVAVRVVERQSGFGPSAQSLAGPILGAFGLGGLVLLLVVFMLLQRENLRGRLMRLIGQERIGLTTHAMADAGHRVSRYLLMQLIINVTYGVPVAIGLYVIGVPNAMLWGALSIVLRFIPYVGPWLAAAMPIALSLAVSDSWTMPILTVSLFVVLELISNNVMEPWLYRASTGVSSLALILAAVFWAWLWGPIGLVLSTPLTVCLVVMGRHVPRLSFLSVLLSDEEPLAPHLEAYHRLLRSDLTEGTRLVDRYLATHDATELYDDVLIPVLIAAEADHGQQYIDAEQRAALHQGIRDILDDISARADSALATAAPVADDATAAEPTAAADLAAIVSDDDLTSPFRVLCVPVRAVRDELSADMLRQALAEQGYDVETLSCAATSAELVDLIAARDPEAVCISVVAPSAVVHARHLCARLHRRLPALRILVGLWSGGGDIPAEAAQSLRAAGAQAVTTSLAQAIAEIGSSPIELSPSRAERKAV